MSAQDDSGGTGRSTGTDVTGIAGLATKALEPVTGLHKAQLEATRQRDRYSSAVAALSGLQSGGPERDSPLDVERLTNEPDAARRSLDKARAEREEAEGTRVTTRAIFGEAASRAAELTSAWTRIAIEIAERVLARGAETPFVSPSGDQAPAALMYGLAVRNAAESADVLGDELRHGLRWSLLPAFLERRRAQRVVRDRLRISEDRLRAAELRLDRVLAEVPQRIAAEKGELKAFLAAQREEAAHDVTRAEAEYRESKQLVDQTMTDETLTPQEREHRLARLRTELAFHESYLARARDVLAIWDDAQGVFRDPA
jgi:hypothetical protein